MAIRMSRLTINPVMAFFLKRWLLLEFSFMTIEDLPFSV